MTPADIPDDATLDAVADLMLEVADAEILPYFRRLRAADITAKSSALDLVTVADRAAERALTPALAARFPGALIVGEEAVSEDPAGAPRLRDVPLAITIDPVDGTRNFAAGLAVFAVMIGFAVRGQPVASIIGDPIARDWAIAAHGRGAWLRRTDGSRERLHTRAARPVEAMEMLGGWGNLPAAARAGLALRLTRFASCSSYRCSGQETRMVAAGQYDGVLYNKLTPWDHVPGVVLVREAGGYAGHLDGAGYDPDRQDGGILYASDEASWHAVRRLLVGTG